MKKVNEVCRIAGISKRTLQYAILEKKGFSGNVSIVSEVQEEQRKVLEYSIEF